MATHQLSRRDARRIAVQAQLLAAPRATGMDEVVAHLTLLQLDPTTAVAPSADLVLWSRLGSSYAPAALEDALARQSLVELQGMARPAADLSLFRAEMARWPGAEPLKEWQEDISDWVDANDACRLDILERLRMDGPLPSSELPDTCVVAWRSSGWNNNRNLRMMLALLVERGEVAAAGRDGRDRLWDLAERVYPDDPGIPAEEAARVLDERRLRALGVARARVSKPPGEPYDVGAAGEEAVIEGVPGRWRVDPELLGTPFTGRTALLSPLDRLLIDRKRMAELFEFDYQLEMYKPVAKRRWGYWAMPVLHGDRLVGKLDATADRDAGVLWVDALHEDEPFPKATAAAVRREIADLAGWLDLELALPGSRDVLPSERLRRGP